ncbi:hypothetical protein TWF225_005947 [Orbilia oligospora]|nr:hypothetical protein TWF225_005947 [Orbilia oligospora]KAF3245934.1 hypothetical protein TWF128_009284 [Orbilia oligospora]
MPHSSNLVQPLLGNIPTMGYKPHLLISPSILPAFSFVDRIMWHYIQTITSTRCTSDLMPGPGDGMAWHGMA